MQVRDQDLAVLLLYCLGYPQARSMLMRLDGRRVATFVTFHDLRPGDVTLFEANVSFLQRRMNVISLDSFFGGELSDDRINVVLTFDDGYKSWVTLALPVLKRLNVPATFFVCSGFVGLPRVDEVLFMRSRLRLPEQIVQETRGLSWTDVKRLVDEGFTIGGHTANHCDLTRLAGERRIRSEIAEDRALLETMTGSRVDYFSYPFGAHLHPQFDLAGMVRASGYRGAVTTLSGFNSSRSDAYQLRRELTPILMSHWAFRARAYGTYGAVRAIRDRAGGLFDLAQGIARRTRRSHA